MRLKSRIEDSLNNENVEQDKFADDSSTKDVNAVGKHKFNTASPDVNTGSLKLNAIEPTSIAKALSDSSWVEVMQEELLQFKLQQVWILVDLPNGKKAIRTKWIFMNKKDERGIMIRNKARLVAQGHRQEKRSMDYNNKQKEDEIFISQDKYVAEILKKFNYSDVKSALTPVDLEKPLVKDRDADDVDVHLYRSMVGSLMYLTASRPDIMFAVWILQLNLGCFTENDYARATQEIGEVVHLED
ncbi:ribonuclease H-like domain, reverse transcriptase, RNA-dependent DNA polymerase [Tanacetum coccineum]